MVKMGKEEEVMRKKGVVGMNKSGVESKSERNVKDYFLFLFNFSVGRDWRIDKDLMERKRWTIEGLASQETVVFEWGFCVHCERIYDIYL